MNLQTMLRRQLLSYLIGQQISCPVTGEVLDIRTAVVLLDRDGDPAYTLSPVGYARANEAGNVAKLCDAKGWTVDASTIPAIVTRRQARAAAGADQLPLEV